MQVQAHSSNALDSAPWTEAEPLSALRVKGVGSEGGNLGAESQGRAGSTEVPEPIGSGRGRGRPHSHHFSTSASQSSF